MLGFEAKHAMMAVIAANVIFFQHQENNRYSYNSRYGYDSFFSVYNQTLKSMMISIFSHANLQHLLVNMYYLWSSGNSVFIATSSQTWRSPLSFLALYFGSGLGGFCGVLALSSLHSKQWDQKLLVNRKSFAETSGIFSSWSRPFADTWTYLTNIDSAANNFLFKTIPRVGASGAIFGIMGARVYTSIFDSLWHRKMTSAETTSMVVYVAMEFLLVPIQLDTVNVLDDNVDHVAHAGGFVSGMLIAAVIQAISRFRMSRQRGGGRRLGGS